MRETFDLLVASLKAFGSLRVDAVKTNINFISKHHFGAVMVRQKYLRLGFIADHEVENDRIIRTQRLGPTRVDHTVLVASPDDIDDELLAWYQYAYTLQSKYFTTKHADQKHRTENTELRCVSL